MTDLFGGACGTPEGVPFRPGLIHALEAGDEFFGEGFAGLSPEEAAGDAAVLFHQQGEGEEFFYILLDVELAVVVQRLSFPGVGFAGVVVRIERSIEQPGRVESEVDEDVAVLLIARDVKERAEAEDADGVGAQAPGRVGVEEVGRALLFVVGLLVGLDGPGEAEAGADGVGWLGGPELPTHLELVGHVVVKLLGGLGDGGLNGGVGGGGVRVHLGGQARVGAGGFGVEALVGGGFGEVNGIRAGSNDAAASDDGELAHDAGEGAGERFQAEVGVPEAEVEAVGHWGHSSTGFERRPGTRD